MALPNIATLLVERERRTLFQFSHARAQHGVATFNNLQMVTNDQKNGIEADGFIFGRDIWGVGTFSSFTSKIGAKYGIE